MLLLTPSQNHEWRSPQGAGTLSFADEQHPDSRKENATHGQGYRTGRTRVKLHGRDDGPERPAHSLPGRGDRCRGARLPLPETPSAEPPQPEKANLKTPAATPARPSRWAVLLARIFEVSPLVCPSCQRPLTFIAFLTDPEPIAQILAQISEPTSPPPLHPARGPPETELGIAHVGGKTQDEVAQESFPDDLNQSPAFDPSEPEPIPDHASRGARDFDQSWEA